MKIAFIDVECDVRVRVPRRPADALHFHLLANAAGFYHIWNGADVIDFYLKGNDVGLKKKRRAVSAR